MNQNQLININNENNNQQFRYSLNQDQEALFNVTKSNSFLVLAILLSIQAFFNIVDVSSIIIWLIRNALTIIPIVGIWLLYIEAKKNRINKNTILLFRIPLIVKFVGRMIIIAICAILLGLLFFVGTIIDVMGATGGIVTLIVFISMTVILIWLAIEIIYFIFIHKLILKGDLIAKRSPVYNRGGITAAGIIVIIRGIIGFIGSIIPFIFIRLPLAFIEELPAEAAEIVHFISRFSYVGLIASAIGSIFSLVVTFYTASIIFKFNREFDY